MPEVSRFYGIVIRLFFNDHPPPHFHAYYGSDEALFTIEKPSLYAGKLPPRATSLVLEWATLHEKDLMEAWRRAKNLEAPGAIDPLP